MNRVFLALALAGVSAAPVWAQNQPKAKPATPAAAPATAPATAPAATTNANIAADVNGDKISLDDLNRLVNTLKESDPGLQTGTPTATKALDDIKGQLLDQLINKTLLVQEAKRRKIALAPKAVDEKVAYYRNQFTSQADFEKWLKTDNQTVAGFRKFITDEFLAQEVSKALTLDVTVTEEDMASYYRAHQEDFDVPQGVSASHILLALNPNAPADAKATANKRAQDLIKQLKSKKTPFAVLAKANSDDASTKDDGGNMRPFFKGEIKDEMAQLQPIEDACFAPNVKAGDILGPITTDFGIHIVRINEVVPEHQMTLAEVKDNPQIALHDIVLRQKIQQRLTDRITAYKATAKIQKYI